MAQPFESFVVASTELRKAPPAPTPIYLLIFLVSFVLLVVNRL